MMELTINLAPQALAELEALKERLGAKDLADAVCLGLGTLKWLTEQLDDYKIILTQTVEGTLKEVNFEFIPIKH